MLIYPDIYFKTVFKWLYLAEHFASLKNGDFSNTDIFYTRYVATRLGCGGIFVHDCYKFYTESNSERISKIGQSLVKLWARVRCFVFF